MPRRPRPAQTIRSEHWLRVAVNDCTQAFDEKVRTAFQFDRSEEIEWLSPIASDGYAEYYDEAFLDRLDIKRLEAPLNSFWPERGPRWDGLGRTKSGKVILIEAKAYPEEAVDFRSKAGEPSRLLINKALAKAKAAFKAADVANWEEPFYQYANRLAHLYFLRTLNKVEAHLLFVCFADAPDVPQPSSVEEWHGAIRIIERALGLGVHPYRRYVSHLVLPVAEMLPKLA